jgi:hypothetical protein
MNNILKRLAATNQIEVMRALAFQAGCVEPFDETITEAHGPRQMEVGSFSLPSFFSFGPARAH